jgi:hypothetical protein
MVVKLLRNKEIYTKFQTTFPKPRWAENRQQIAPPLTKNGGVLIGHAFDYLLRFSLKKKYFEHTNDREKWIAEIALDFLKTLKYPSLYQPALKIIKNAKNQYIQFLDTGILNDELLRSCILMAKIDTIFRTGANYYPDTVKDFLFVDENDIQDLKNLISIVPFEEFKPQVGILCNPKFGSASFIVGGSDADLIIDNAIIDIKTTKDTNQVRNPYILPQYWYQCVGYYTLYRIDTMDGVQDGMIYPGFPETKISQIGFYFARHGFLCKWNIEDIVEEKKFNNFMSWFIPIAIEEGLMKT